MSAPVLSAILRDARRRLREGGSADADLDARLLLGEATGFDAAQMVLRGAEPVPAAVAERFDAMVARRIAGEPTHRIIGRRSFFDHDFALSPATLEPRPDTEALVRLCRPAVEAAIQATGGCVLADVGTGTGAIAVTLLALYPTARALAVDLSVEALETATANAAAAGVSDRFVPLCGDHLAPVTEIVDLVVSNPPYIPTGDIVGLSREVREHDPILALDGGADGLRSYRAIAADAPRVLSSGGAVALEIGEGQGPAVEAVFGREGFAPCQRASDLGGIERALLFRRA